MRNLFLLLLLANLLFLAWRYWVALPEVPATRLLAASEANIEVLTSARAEAQRRALAAPGVAAGLPVPPNGRCLRIGPVVEGQVADDLRARLGADGFDAATFAEEGQVWVGHWVQLGAVATREEADRVVARLAAGGLPDAYVLQTAPPFSISLGVFRDRERAEAVAKASARLGFKPQMTDRYRTGSQYWLSVVVPAGRDLPPGILGENAGQQLRAEPVRCPTGAVGSARTD